MEDNENQDRDYQISRMPPEEYIEKRLKDQITWYDSKSSSNKKQLMFFSITEVAFSCSIPFLAGYASESPCVVFSIGLLGLLIAIIASIKSILNLQENWIEYRTTAESLKKEQNLFLTHSEPYDDTSTAYGTLVHRVETLVSKENTNWAQYMMNPNK